MRSVMFAILLAVVVGSAIIWVLLCSSKFVSRRFPSTDVVVPPTAATIAVMFALFVAFGASEMAQRSRDLRLAVQKEVSVARAISKYAESVGPSANSVRQGLVEYLQAVNALELAWLEGPADTESPAQPTADTMVQVVTLFVVQSAASAPVKSLIVSKVDELRQARTERIALSMRTSGAIPQWIGLATMAIITQLIIALGYVGKPNAMRTSVGIFTCGAVAAMCYLAWIGDLIGPSKVEAAMLPLKDILAVILSQS